MLVMMSGTVANPKYILKQGKLYDLPKWLADIVLSNKNGGIPVIAGDGSVSRFESAGVPYNEKLHGRRPILRVPARVDPMDIPEEESEPEVEYLQTEDD
jgi:hypothetical protein